jgi:hypothetical protein
VFLINRHAVNTCSGVGEELQALIIPVSGAAEWSESPNVTQCRRRCVEKQDRYILRIEVIEH